MNLFSFFINFLLEMAMTKLPPVINLCTQKLLESFFILLNICNESRKVES